MSSGIIIVSNRLPVSVKKVGTKLEFSPSAGGLATGLASYANNRRNKWIGWPGIASDELNEKDKQDITRELKKHNCYPVYLTKSQVDNFYSGFANSVLWPAFHEMEFTKNSPDKWWRAMREVNKLFAETTLELSSAGSDIWVHDYQLPLVPTMLRKKRPRDKIGFFLHIPFPRYETFSKLPHHEQILNGLLGSDLIGFHTPDYVRNFLDCCDSANIGNVGPRKLILPNRVIRVDDFPMGIDYNKFARTARAATVKAEVLRLRAKYGRKKIILTSDRLDPSKGLVERLKAYREFLKQNPKQRSKVVMVMLVVPSRTDIPRYKRLKNQVEKLVDETNEEFGTLRWQPIDYIFKNLPFNKYAALYQAADVAFIAPIKDGMNLVAKEYLASQPDDRGVLILSETAGAAGQLKNAILVNPKKPQTLVNGLTEALTRPHKNLLEHSRKMRKLIAKSTVQNWAGNFMDTLQESRPTGKQLGIARRLAGAQESTLLGAYKHSRHRYLFLDYDGVLAGFKSNPDDAKPTTKLKNVLKKLTADPSNKLVIISGRSRENLADWLGDIDNLTLVAEHGAFVKKPSKTSWTKHTMTTSSWYDKALKIMENSARQTPGSHVEPKATALVWHYRDASAYYAQKSLVPLKFKLSKIIAQHSNVHMQSGHKILEIKQNDVDKGTSALGLLGKNNDFILALGDDTTDEAMFKSLPSRSFSIKVGPGRTAAHYRLKNVEEVHALLVKLSKIKP